MNRYESLIDVTDFRTIAAYLQNESSPIQCVLHVKERQILPSLAETVQQELEKGRFQTGVFPESVQRLFQEGSVRISLKNMPGGGDHPSFVNPASVNPGARSEVIYMEPFYLVHTPGLFEGKQHREGFDASRQEAQGGKKQSHGVSY